MEFETSLSIDIILRSTVICHTENKNTREKCIQEVLQLERKMYSITVKIYFLS
jgi:hypothetical protein